MASEEGPFWPYARTILGPRSYLVASLSFSSVGDTGSGFWGPLRGGWRLALVTNSFRWNGFQVSGCAHVHGSGSRIEEQLGADDDDDATALSTQPATSVKAAIHDKNMDSSPPALRSLQPATLQGTTTAQAFAAATAAHGQYQISPQTSNALFHPTFLTNVPDRAVPPAHQEESSVVKLDGKIKGLKFVPDPPALSEWRERLFHVDGTIVMTEDQYVSWTESSLLALTPHLCQISNVLAAR